MLTVRDVWARADIANITASKGWVSPSLNASGGHALHVLTPYF